MRSRASRWRSGRPRDVPRRRALAFEIASATIQVVAPLTATLYTDPGCPWAYSASPAFAVLQWRYGDELRWRLGMIRLAENGAA